MLPSSHVLAACEAKPTFSILCRTIHVCMILLRLYLKVCRYLFSGFLRCTLQVESGSGWTRKSPSTRGAREKAKAKPKAMAKAKVERPRARARGSLAINCCSCEWALSVTVLGKVQFLNATFVFLGVLFVKRG